MEADGSKKPGREFPALVFVVTGKSITREAKQAPVDVEAKIITSLIGA
jgi:hypothetical protein